MKFTIYEEQGKDLCRSCSYSHIYTNERGHETKFCTASGREGCHELRVYVTDCNRYEAKNQLTDWDARRIGWVLDVNKKGEYIGFRPPKKNDDE